MEYSEEDKFTKNKERLVRFFVVFFAIFAISVIIFVVTDAIYKAGKKEVTIKCAPYESEVFIDGERIKNNSKKWLKIGEHHVLCFMPGFEISDEIINVTDDYKSYIKSLLPITNEGKLIYENRIDDYMDLEDYVGSETNENILSEKDRNLVSVLRYTNDRFGIGSTIEDDNLIATITTHKPGYIDLAVNKLLTLTQEAGLSIAEYRFRINDFINQLEDRLENTKSDLEEFIINSFATDVEIWNSGKIDEGDYYFALIATVQPSTGEMVVYRAVLMEKGETFEFVDTPYPILTIYNTRDVPKEILDLINQKEPMWHGNS